MPEALQLGASEVQCLEIRSVSVGAETIIRNLNFTLLSLRGVTTQVVIEITVDSSDFVPHQYQQLLSSVQSPNLVVSQ